MTAIHNMFQHVHWANVLILQTLEKQSNEQTIRLFSHILLAERVWITRMEGKDSSELAIWSILSLETCQELLQQNHQDFLQMIEGDLDQMITYQNSTGKAFTNTKEDILIHVALHGHYHRGQINLLLRQNTVEPIGTDYILLKRD